VKLLFNYNLNNKGQGCQNRIHHLLIEYVKKGKVGRTFQPKMAMGIFLLEILRNIVRLIYRTTVTIFISKSQSENCMTIDKCC